MSSSFTCRHPSPSIIFRRIKVLRIHYLQHVPFEGLGSIEAWIQAHDYPLSASHLYRGDPLPSLQDFDWLIVMGGPMAVSDEAQYPWLADEQRFIRAAIDAGKHVLGICLGAQLIAAALGARVGPNPQREIGWFPVTSNQQGAADAIATLLNDSLLAFHWHGDTFELPPGCRRLASSEACRNQAFSFEQRVFGFQFHLETTPKSARALIEHCASELDDSRYVQSAHEILALPKRFTEINNTMSAILSTIEKLHPGDR